MSSCIDWNLASSMEFNHETSKQNWIGWEDRAKNITGQENNKQQKTIQNKEKNNKKVCKIAFY